jgi:hypothetical protein
MMPPVPEPLEATRFEVRGCAFDRIRIDTLLLVHSSDGDRIPALQDFFGPISEQTGGHLVLAQPEDHVQSVVKTLVGPNDQ